MEIFWNTIYFFAYRLVNKLYILSLKPTIWYFHSSLVKKVLEKNGRTPEMALKDFTFALTDKRVGQSSFWAVGIMFAIPFSICFIFESLIFSYVDNSLSAIELFICILIIYGVAIGLMNYFLLGYQDKYIKYFKKFENQPREWKVKWAWISAGFISFPVIVLIVILIISIINVKYS